MTRIALIAALCAMLGLVVGLWWVVGQRDAQRAEVARLAGELATAQAIAEQARQAAAVHKAWLDRATVEKAAAVAREAEFTGKEGGDAPLSDYLRDALDRVR